MLISVHIIGVSVFNFFMLETYKNVIGLSPYNVDPHERTHYVESQQGPYCLLQ